MVRQICAHIKPGDIAINVGAHIGTLCAGMLEAGANVTAFEPNPDAAACLRYNCPRAVVIERAASDKDGEAFMQILGNAGASHISEDGLRVATTTLDGHILKPSLIVMDCEGYEVHALRGARETIRKHKPAIICEVNQGALERAGESEASLLQVIHDLGYSAKILQPDCDWGDPQFDFLALPI